MIAPHIERQILIAADHGGYELKKFLLGNASQFPKVKFKDLGTHSSESVDYPDYAKKLCQSLLKGEGDLGVLICGTGQGMVMQANRYKGIRAALCWSVEVAKLSREHNNSNVLCLGGRVIEPHLALEILKTWLETDFAGGRHQKRTDKFDTNL